MILVYDGDCGFCTRSAEWVEARARDGSPAIIAGQTADLDELGLTDDDVATAAWFIDDDGHRHRGHAAIGRALVEIGGPWRMVGRLITLPPISWLARGVYALVARYRHRMPGATDACRVDS